MVLLLQRGREIELHGSELALGGADLVVALGGRHDARGIFRIGAERHHIRGHATHRPHQQPVQRQIDERGGDRRDDQRQEQDADGKIHHRLAQRRLVDHDLDEFAAHRSLPHHPHHVGVAGDQRVEGLDDGAVPRHVAHVDLVGDRMRHVPGREQAAVLAHLQGDSARADAFQNLPRDRLGHFPARRGLEHQRRGVSGGQAILQPVQPKIGDRRHVDQHFRNHHEQEREKEKLAR